MCSKTIIHKSTKTIIKQNIKNYLQIFTIMKKLILTLTIISVFSLSSFAQEEEKAHGFSLSMNTDAFFGLYNFAAGYVSLSDKLDFTYYGIMWSDIPNGTAGAFGAWTEFGAGINLNVADGILGINPQIGLLSGTLLSGSEDAIFGEGIVPNLTVNLGTDLIEGQAYFGYYLPLFASNGLPEDTDANSFIHYWIYAGANIGFVTVGLQFEQLSQPTGGGDETLTNYSYIGPYINFGLWNGGGLRFTAGPELSDDSTADFDSFYKLTFAHSF